MSKPEGHTLWEMMTSHQKVVAEAIAAPSETKPDVFNPLGLHLEDVVLYTRGAEQFRFQVVEIDVFDRGDEGKIVDYHLYQKPGDGVAEIDRYMRVFPGNTPNGKPSMDILLLELRFSISYDQSVEAVLERGEFPLQGDEYQGFVRNGGITLPHEARVTEFKIGQSPNERRMKYWDFVRIKDGAMQDACFIEMDLDSKGFDAYIATMIENDALRFLKKK